MIRVLTLFLFLLGGICAYLLILNRWIIHFRDGRIKLTLIIGGLFVILGGSTAIPLTPLANRLIILPAGVLAFVITMEAKRFMIRRAASNCSVERHRSLSSEPHPITTTRLRIERFTVPCPGWDGAVRIAHVSDLHVNESIPRSYYHSVMERIGAEKPDLIFLTGDFVTRVHNIPLLEMLLCDLNAPLGCYAVLGNHDHWAGERQIDDALRAASVVRLKNRHLRITDPTGSSIIISGCELPWADSRYENPSATESDLVLVLSHTPDNIYRISGSGSTAVFAGHYHAGQIRLPLIGTLVIPSVYGRRFDHGHFVVRNTHLFVSAGIGAAVPPLRLYSNPDFFIVEFKGENMPDEETV